MDSSWKIVTVDPNAPFRITAPYGAYYYLSTIAPSMWKICSYHYHSLRNKTSPFVIVYAVFLNVRDFYVESFGTWYFIRSKIVFFSSLKQCSYMNQKSFFQQRAFGFKIPGGGVGRFVKMNRFALVISSSPFNCLIGLASSKQYHFLRLRLWQKLTKWPEIVEPLQSKTQMFNIISKKCGNQNQTYECLTAEVSM